MHSCIYIYIEMHKHQDKQADRQDLTWGLTMMHFYDKILVMITISLQPLIS